jgi:hypothetical protein
VSSRRPHEPEVIQLLITRKPGGGWILRTPFTPGWAFPATTPAELARGVELACTEYAVGAYARLRGVLYDLAATEEVVIPPAAQLAGTAHPGEAPDEVCAARRRRQQRHPGTYEPECWVELPDGGMLSPRGRRYGPQTRVASAVRRARGG